MKNLDDFLTGVSERLAENRKAVVAALPAFIFIVNTLLGLEIKVDQKAAELWLALVIVALPLIVWMTPNKPKEPKKNGK